MRGKNFFWVMIIVGLFIFTACQPQQFKTTLFRPFENSSTLGPRAMAWDGRDLIIGALNQTIAVRNIQTRWYYTAEQKMDPANYYSHGRFPSQFSNGASICGMAWEGDCCEYGYLWVADIANKTISKFDFNFNKLVSFPSPGPGPSGMTFDGTHLWVADEVDGNIYKIAVSDGTVLETYRAPIRYPTGLAWDGKNLWVVGMELTKRSQKSNVKPALLKMSFTDGVIDEQLVLPRELTRPGSLEWVDGIFWIGDQTANMVFKLWRNHAILIDKDAVQKIERVM
ncbi:MAG: hypothetical protein DSY90_05390 [Deltaproteobacteria bacterium]|nr:MAG: hypothetical protein DSY90_05390 [Deltaproteobacteria bacterium]